MIEDLIIDGKPAQLLRRESIEWLIERVKWSDVCRQVWERWQARGMVARPWAGLDNDHVWVWYEFKTAEQCPDPYYGRYLLIKSI